jgi:hypothetical protein
VRFARQARLYTANAGGVPKPINITTKGGNSARMCVVMLANA